MACSSNPATLEMYAASRRSSDPALHEAHIRLGAGAGTSRIRFSGKPICAAPSKTDVPPRLPLDLAEVLATLAAVPDQSRNSRSLEEEFEVGQLVASSELEYTEVLIGDGSKGEGL